MTKRILNIEHKFLKEEQAVKINGSFIYKSQDGTETILLDHFLSDFKEWLIERGIVERVKKEEFSFQYDQKTGRKTLTLKNKEITK